MPEVAIPDAPPTVLVVEDDALIAMMMVDVLEEAGFRATWSPDGATGAVDPAGLVAAMVDLRLGDGRDGRAVVRRLRGLRPGLPVVVATGFGADAPEADLRGLGGPTLRLHKPFGSGELLAALAAALGAVPPRRRRATDRARDIEPANAGRRASQAGPSRSPASLLDRMPA